MIPCSHTLDDRKHSSTSIPARLKEIGSGGIGDVLEKPRKWSTDVSSAEETKRNPRAVVKKPSAASARKAGVKKSTKNLVDEDMDVYHLRSPVYPSKNQQQPQNANLNHLQNPNASLLQPNRPQGFPHTSRAHQSELQMAYQDAWRVCHPDFTLVRDIWG
ncbi:hypothetical protein L2E82_29607 [Cichorium intybus]|uniref:Uncharacterized protein n=1 Tax=Cichorium intybus TaxID=13427 RepID=A0ACB9CXY5_CICIN|nr:hypothetical protein L2E82_29607 [Cichorium intybus]